MKPLVKFAILAAALVLSACSLTSEDRSAVRDAAVGELLYRIDQLQALDMAQVKVDPEVRIIADAACSAIAIGAPFLVDAINAKIEADESKVTIAEFQGSLHAVCDVVRALMVEKATAAAPVDAPVPIASPGTSG